MSNSAEPVLVLASASPRRRDLLAREGVRFEVIPADIPEEHKPGESPEDLVCRLAFEKAAAVAKRLGDRPARWVLGSDTIVVIDDDVLGKPRDTAEAERLLGRLTGRTHAVITGYAFVDSSAPEEPSRGRVAQQTSQVTMRDASAEEIAAYVATGEPMDKAGAYAVQGEGARFVTRVEGSEDNVIGLPVSEVLAVWTTLQGGGAP
ncbi:MAG: Maf family protein [Myxococcota bacterium]|jgi:septum formation protein|nr:Maf family protein [Myxococcota bacterium]